MVIKYQKKADPWLKSYGETLTPKLKMKELLSLKLKMKALTPKLKMKRVISPVFILRHQKKLIFTSIVQNDKGFKLFSKVLITKYKFF